MIGSWKILRRKQSTSMKPEELVKCHQTLSSWVGCGHETKSSLETTKPRVRERPEKHGSFVMLLSFFCRELRCVPDIWSLVEWSNWLTPRNMGRRYDTVFYLCCCETTPPISADGTEVVDAKVCVCLCVVCLCVVCLCVCLCVVYVRLCCVCLCVVCACVTVCCVCATVLCVCMCDYCVCMCDCVLCVYV